jgi:hypothetical protein
MGESLSQLAFQLIPEQLLPLGPATRTRSATVATNSARGAQEWWKRREEMNHDLEDPSQNDDHHNNIDVGRKMSLLMAKPLILLAAASACSTLVASRKIILERMDIFLGRFDDHYDDGCISKHSQLKLL